MPRCHNTIHGGSFLEEMGMYRLIASRWRSILRLIAAPAGIYLATTTIVIMGVFAQTSARRETGQPGARDVESVLQRCSMFGDGYHFVEIASRGYSYHPEARSSVAFFPVFPLTGRFVAALTGLKPEIALLLASNGLLLGAFILLWLYARRRYGDAPADVPGYALLAFGLFPTTFFFRMNYSESSFLFFAILTMLAIQRRWPLAVIALIAGLATATHPVGIAVVPVFCMHLWQRSPGWRTFTFRSTLLLPLAVGGLALYMLCQYLAFGQPLAFALTQEHWSFRPPELFGDKVMAFLSHEPILSVYDPSSEAYWQRIQPEPRAWSNLALANPLCFLLALGLVIAGRWKQWLNWEETLLAALLILIPYLTNVMHLLARHGGYASNVRH
jgi:hypothetical protein